MKKNVPQTRDWERLQIYRASSIFPVTRDTYHLFEAEAKKNWLTRIHLGIKHVDKKKIRKKEGEREQEVEKSLQGEESWKKPTICVSAPNSCYIGRGWQSGCAFSLISQRAAQDWGEVALTSFKIANIHGYIHETGKNR